MFLSRGLNGDEVELCIDQRAFSPNKVLQGSSLPALSTCPTSSLVTDNAPPAF